MQDLTGRSIYAGNRVAFAHTGYVDLHVGTVIKINDKTITVQVPNSWRNRTIYRYPNQLIVLESNDTFRAKGDDDA